MKAKPRPILMLLATASLALAACWNRPASIVADSAKRKQVIDALVADPAARGEVIDRLVGPPTDRAVVIDRILKDDAAAGDLVAHILANDHGRALVASKVAADTGAKTFIRMLMLTGVMGESMSQRQAEALGLGEAFAYGNQRRTMVDLRTIGVAVDRWSKEHEGRYPVCSDFNEISSCLQKKLPADTLAQARLKDAWGHPILYRTDNEGSKYVLVSYGTDGMDDGLGMVGPTASFDCDIVFAGGDFIQWPGWIHKADIH
jgi:hypothetical protein